MSAVSMLWRAGVFLDIRPGEHQCPLVVRAAG
jgi:hypothetical protein